jgi:hypothetical protein
MGWTRAESPPVSVSNVRCTETSVSGRCSRQGKARGSRGWSDPETRSEINASKTPPITSFGINGPYPRGMFVGDARVSTQDQGLELQRGALEKVGCSKIFTDVEWRNESARRG